MAENLDEIRNRLKEENLSQEEVVDLYRKAFDYIDTRYEEEKQALLKGASGLTVFFDEIGKANISLFDKVFGAYLCSKEKLKKTEKEKLNFIASAVEEVRKVKPENNTTDSTYEEKYYDSLKEIDLLKMTNIKIDKKYEEYRRTNIKFYQKMLGIIGENPKSNEDTKIKTIIEDFLENESIKIIWNVSSPEDEILFDVYKISMSVENEVRLPALICENLIMEKGLIYRQEK